jgi:hypothetical protein
MDSEEQAELIKQHSQLNFGNDDEFVSYEKKKYNQNLVGLDSDIHYTYPEARPIGEMLMMIGDDTNVLSGASLDDEEDVNGTLESISAAEKSLGSKMQAPEESTRFYQVHGNKYENLLS